MLQIGTGIGVIFQRTKSCSQFYCSGDNTYRQYYQQKALEVHNNNSLLHYCCKPCIWCDIWPDLMGRLFLCYGYFYGIKPFFVSENIISKHNTLTWLTCNKQFWCLIFTTYVPLLYTTFWHRLIHLQLMFARWYFYDRPLCLKLHILFMWFLSWGVCSAHILRLVSKLVFYTQSTVQLYHGNIL